jgi:hypothetical protein
MVAALPGSADQLFSKHMCYFVMKDALGIDVNHACADISTNEPEPRWHRGIDVLSVVDLLD